jgi:murein L,D-transpeptidase YcbB/YkuD
VPTKLAVEDLSPKICADPDYLAKKQITVYRDWQANAPKVDPSTINWCEIKKKTRFPYRLQQAPGIHNPLGKIKFMFPNKHAVYLHDTPDKNLFGRTVRDFSSGCIRVEKPYALAKFLLKSNPQWTGDALQPLMENGERKIIPVEEKVDVHLVYFTAWADETGAVHFRNDIYGQDHVLDQALKAQPPLDSGR